MENEFDRLIKSKLESLDVNYNPADWERMEEKLIEESEINPAIEDVYLDGMVFDSLQDVDVQYDPAHWEMMEARLSDPYAIRRRLMKYKILEVALVALFLITIGRLIPFQQVEDDAPAIAQEQVTPENLSGEGENMDPIAGVKMHDLSSNVVDPSPNTILEPTVSTAFAQADQITVVNQQLVPRKNENSNAENFLSHSIVDPLPLKFAIRSDEMQQWNSSTAASNSSLPNLTAQLETMTEKALAEDALNYVAVEEMKALPARANTLFPLTSEKEMDDVRVLTELPKHIRIRIGMLLGPDANYVMTPSNRSIDLGVFHRYALGYSGGFTLGLNYGRWEVETGALYSSISYGSRNIFEIKGSFADGGYVKQGLEGAHLDVLRVPLQLKYNFTEQSKWNFYVFSGVSANAALETFYKITTTDLGNSDASRNFAGRAPSPPDIEPEKAQENFDGIFEGGLLSKNLFYTTNLGIGLERYFTPRMSVFLQPNFQYQFSKGLGPQSDRVNSVSLLAGAKVTLKKRRK